MDVDRLKHSWSLVAAHGDEVPLFFYSTLFLNHPDVRQMFPTNMAGQRDRLVTALGHVVSNVDQLDRLVGFLRDLGADHRKFAVTAEHYPAVGEALLITLRHFLGPQWTEDLAADWSAAYGLVAQVMTDAAREAEKVSPPWWVGEVVAHERRTFDVAVLTLRPSYLLPFVPGQSIGVSVPAVRTWRYYSPANAPRPDGTLELHVRAAPGGMVSSRLVYGLSVGDRIHLASPVGDRLSLARSRGANLLLLAGGTGWAPLKALVEQVAAEHAERRVQLYIGARSQLELYDAESVDKLAAAYPWLTVRYALGGGPAGPGGFPGGDAAGGDGGSSRVVDLALADGDFRDRAVYLCGSDEMVSGSVRALRRAGYDPGRLHHEGLGAHWYGPAWRTHLDPIDQYNPAMPGGNTPGGSQ